MKKLLACILTVVLCLFCLASCSDGYKENTWFSEEKLSECLVSELPVIEKDYVNKDDGDIYVSFTPKECEAYINEIYEYLKLQGFKYLGTRGAQASTLAGTFTTYYFEPASELSEFYVDGAYRFVYSDGTLNESSRPIFCIISIYGYEAKNLEYGMKNFAYNTVITLRYETEAPLSGRYVLQESDDTSGPAHLLIDYEKDLKEQVDKKNSECPDYEFYYYPVSRVYCTYVLSKEDSADAIVEKYDMKNLFAQANILAYNAIEMISITFDRNDFTEEVYQKIKEINDEEALITDLYVDFEREINSAYMPKIEYYTDHAVKLDYEIAECPPNLYGNSSFIIKSKEEYDSYIDYLIETIEFDFQKESLNAQKDLYDEAFFEENALIITKVIVRGSGSIKLTLNGLYTSDNKAYVVIRTDVPGGVCTDDMQYASFVFKVNKSDVINVDEVITLE